MNSERKIEYMLRKVREVARISPAGFFYVDCAPLVDAEVNGGMPIGAPVIISRMDQVNILEKFVKDGLLFSLKWEKDYKGAWTALMNLEKETDTSPYASGNNARREKVLEVHLKSGTLCLNEAAGFLQLNKVSATLNSTSREFKTILLLAKNPHYQATYAELIEGENKQSKRRELGYVIRNIKEALGILPKDRSQNRDIIKNIKGQGYRLIT